MSLESPHSLLNEYLQEFAHEIGIICALEAGGKIDSKEAYSQVKAKWKELKAKKKELFPKIDQVG
ncbi:DUF7219 family protein [Pseudobacteriovorax antillogorgiicola]|uniref:Uncharacterized protein n=1 Tax=Pseudobacteriovorax antillogorgiicola TaxID=1513793 RepID=A0A1Y6C2F3_9BACT|nr:hypothetical protein [Pseudobacteriovorax antillogorgiicola]TCS50657.1 hypothetical protein EDD56_11239 [Pseudobacteriovorax antillogorgiicola]SMF39810.1 hypothetical protein SAMN06296036_11238 [Pseudobacteriovorax antillogorgiicola]